MRVFSLTFSFGRVIKNKISKDHLGKEMWPSLDTIRWGIQGSGPWPRRNRPWLWVRGRGREKQWHKWLNGPSSFLAVTNDLTDEEMCFSWQVTTSPLCARLHLMKPERRFPGLFENGKAWFMLSHGHLQTGTGHFFPNPLLPVWGTQQVSPAQRVPAYSLPWILLLWWFGLFMLSEIRTEQFILSAFVRQNKDCGNVKAKSLKEQ